MKFWRLVEKGHGTWMTTHLQEIAQLVPILNAARGRVLVGGLGLGCAAHLMQRTLSVGSVYAVEREPDVVKLATKFIDHKIEVETRDLFEYLRSLRIVGGRAHDYAFYDIWASTGERDWVASVVPLRRLSRGVVFKVVCWLESDMIGQIRMAVPSACVFDSEELAGRSGSAHYWVFRRAAEKLHGDSLITIPASQSMERLLPAVQAFMGDRKMQALLKLYATGAGSIKWERTFGDLWDEVYPHQTEAKNGRASAD